VQVLNISLCSYEHEDILCTTFQRLAAAGCIIVVAAGSVQRNGTINKLGTLLSVITVGSSTSEGEPTPQSQTYFSQGKPEVFAPGVNILGALRGSKDRGCRMDGTSLAAPIVTAIVALLVQRQQDLQQSDPSRRIKTDILWIRDELRRVIPVGTFRKPAVNLRSLQPASRDNRALLRFFFKEILVRLLRFSRRRLPHLASLVKSQPFLLVLAIIYFEVRFFWWESI